MAAMGEIGQYVKLETIMEKQKKAYGGVVKKEKEKLRQPLFQFRYDSEKGRFIREVKENLGIDNAVKDPNYNNGFWL